MKKASVAALILGVGLAATPQNSRAALVLYYNFEANVVGPATNNAVIDNLIAGPDGVLHFGTAGGSATFTLGGAVPGGNLGKSLQLTPATDASTNLEAPNIDTNFTALALGITPSAAYTAMAWANFASATADNMIFGQGQTVSGTTQVLHHGSRNGNYHSGHWADDVGPDQGINIPTGQGSWHHVAFTNDTSGTQAIYVDGVQVATGGTGTAGEMIRTLNVLIGTSGNAGSFSGGLDEIKVYNEILTAAQIQQASTATIPEPASFALVALGAGALGLLGRRRRA